MALLRKIDNLLIRENRIGSSIEFKLKPREISHERDKQHTRIFKVSKEHLSFGN